jgi:hypothetical protein
MSSGVIVSPRPTCTLKASSGTAPARPPLVVLVLTVVVGGGLLR